MIEIRGWVIMPIEERSDYLAVSGHIEDLCKGQFAIYGCNIHNAVAAIHIFDFSNHLGERLKIIRKIEQYLNSQDYEIQGLFVVSDDESEICEAIKVGNPFTPFN